MLSVLQSLKDKPICFRYETHRMRSDIWRLRMSPGAITNPSKTKIKTMMINSINVNAAVSDVWRRFIENHGITKRNGVFVVWLWARRAFMSFGGGR